MNTLGGYTCYLLSLFFLADVVHNNLKDKFIAISSKVKEHEGNLFFYMCFLRVFPGSPNWLMNISFAHISCIRWY